MIMTLIIPVTLEHVNEAQAEIAAIDQPVVTHQIKVGNHVIPGHWKAIGAEATYEDGERVHWVTYSRMVA